MAIVGLITAFLIALPLVIKFFTKTPQEKQDEFFNELGTGMKNAEDPETHDPSDLSKFINKL